MTSVRFLAKSDQWNAVQNLTIAVMAILNGFIGTVIISQAGNVASQNAAATILNVGTAFGAVDMLKNSVVDVMIANAAALTSIAGIGWYSMYSSDLGKHALVSWLSVAPVFISVVAVGLYFVEIDIFEHNASMVRVPARNLNYGQLIDELDPISHVLRLLYVFFIAAISFYIGQVPIQYHCLEVAIHGHTRPQWVLSICTLISASLLVLFEAMHFGRFLYSRCAAGTHAAST